MAVKKQIEFSDETEIWEQQPKESDDHHGWFRQYRSLGPKRSVTDLVDFAGRKLSYLQRVAWSWRWKERAHAFDRHEQDMQDEDQRKSRTEAAERRGNLGRAFAISAANYLGRAQNGDHASARTACRLAETAARLDLSVYGGPEKTAGTRELMEGGQPFNLAQVPTSDEVRNHYVAELLERVKDDPNALAAVDPAALLYGPEPDETDES